MDRILISPFPIGLPGSVALNFGIPGSSQCDNTCLLKGTACYSEASASRHLTLHANLAWKQAHTAEYLRAILTRKVEVQQAPWIRFSSHGSVPRNPTATQRALFAVLSSYCDPGRTHFPVESIAKAELYRELGFHPRVSLATRALDSAEGSAVLRAGFPVSLTTPTDRTQKRWTIRAKAEAKTLQRNLRQSHPGLKVRVCPAKIGSAKCGACQLCASGPNAADVVIYPAHR